MPSAYKISSLVSYHIKNASWVHDAISEDKLTNTTGGFQSPNEFESHCWHEPFHGCDCSAVKGYSGLLIWRLGVNAPAPPSCHCGAHEKDPLFFFRGAVGWLTLRSRTSWNMWRISQDFKKSFHCAVFKYLPLLLHMCLLCCFFFSVKNIHVVEPSEPETREDVLQCESNVTFSYDTVSQKYVTMLIIIGLKKKNPVGKHFVDEPLHSRSSVAACPITCSVLWASQIQD